VQVDTCQDLALWPAAIAPLGMRVRGAGPGQSGAEARALQTLRALEGRRRGREAFGVRTIHRRFANTVIGQRPRPSGAQAVRFTRLLSQTHTGFATDRSTFPWYPSVLPKERGAGREDRASFTCRVLHSSRADLRQSAPVSTQGLAELGPPRRGISGGGGRGRRSNRGQCGRRGRGVRAGRDARADLAQTTPCIGS
jgi:hypothetical protein